MLVNIGININYKHKGITSTALCPGFTTTGFHTASGVQDEMDRVPRFMVFPAERIANYNAQKVLITSLPRYLLEIIA